MSSKYGLLPMSMGGLLYKATKERTKFELELMNLANQQAINYAEAYAGYDADGKLKPQDGVVGEYISAAYDAAEKDGDFYRQDAINSLIQAGIGAGVILGTGFMYYKTSDSALDDDIEDATAMQKDLNGPSGAHVALKEDVEDVEKPDSLPLKDEAVEQKLEDWSEVGGSKFKNYQKLDQSKEIEAANADRELNQRAMEHAKADPELKPKIQKNLEEHIKELNEQKRALSQKFNNFIQAANMMQPDLTAIGQTNQNFKKADDKATADQQQAAAQVLNSAAQKQSSFIDTQQQAAQQFKQAADADAASYGQLQQTRGS